MCDSKLSSRQSWREYYHSIDFVLYLIITSHYGKYCSNNIDLGNHKCKYRFVAWYSHTHLMDLTNANQFIQNLESIVRHVEFYNLNQFKPDYNVINDFTNRYIMQKYNETLICNLKYLLQDAHRDFNPTYLLYQNINNQVIMMINGGLR